MSAKLPPNLLALFQPRPPLRYLPPADHSQEDRHTAKIDGVSAFLGDLQAKAANAHNESPPTESKMEAADRKKLEKQQKQNLLLTEGYKQLYKPNEDENIRGDAFQTLFVARLPYDVGTKDLEKEFGRFGPIERIRIVTDKANKPTGYAFVLFEKERDMKSAYKECEHLTIRGRRVLVDVERGRTVTGWRPRRFGGGLGGRHYTKAPPKPTGFGPPSGPGFRGGGFRGGFRGGGGGFGGGDRRGGGRGGFGGGRGGGGGGGYPPAGPRQGGFGGDRGGRFDDRNPNFEPPRKRPYDGGGYDDSRQRRRY